MKPLRLNSVTDTSTAVVVLILMIPWWKKGDPSSPKHPFNLTSPDVQDS